MPKYKNSTGEGKVLGTLIVPPHESVESKIFYPDLPSGVTKTAEYPMYNPVLYSGSINASDTVDIPDYNGKVKIKLHLLSGEVDVAFNESDNTPKLNLKADGTWETEFPARMVRRVLVVFTSGGVLQIDVFKR